MNGNVKTVNKQKGIDMIAANELRIGNWVMHGDSEILKPAFRNKHYQLSPTDLGWVFSNPNNKMYNPIPLTGEILLACGFEHEEKEARLVNLKVFHVYTKDAFTFNSIHGWWYNGQQLDCPPQYLHQLQNLYYSLTNTEIIYKP